MAVGPSLTKYWNLGSFDNIANYEYQDGLRPIMVFFENKLWDIVTGGISRIFH